MATRTSSALSSRTRRAPGTSGVMARAKPASPRGGVHHGSWRGHRLLPNINAQEAGAHHDPLGIPGLAEGNRKATHTPARQARAYPAQDDRRGQMPAGWGWSRYRGVTHPSFRAI